MVIYFLFGVLLAIFSGGSFSNERAEDSVLNGKRRGTSSVGVGQKGEFFYVLKAVPLGSNVSREHVRYGPFSNTSESQIKIYIDGRQGNDWQQFGGWIDGVKIRESNVSIDFDVPPGSEYYFTAKDTAQITVSTPRIGMTTEQIGIPSESDFSRPTGKPYACVVLTYGEDSTTDPPRYIYRVGKISNRSVILDDFNRHNRDFTYGPAPAQPIPCSKIDESRMYGPDWDTQQQGGPDGG